jgi:hypothetical protein
MHVIYVLEQLSTSNRMSVNLVFTQWMATNFGSPPIIRHKPDLGQCVTKLINIFQIFMNIHD